MLKPKVKRTPGKRGAKVNEKMKVADKEIIIFSIFSGETVESADTTKQTWIDVSVKQVLLAHWTLTMTHSSKHTN